MRWRHVVISTVNSWLPGDPRGFRSREHKIHSSGDYKNPPPPGEHKGLYNYSKKISGDPVVIPRDLRPVVGQAVLGKVKKLNYRVLAVSVAGMHAHLLIELPDDRRLIRHVIGQCKTVSSHAIRHRLPGRVWGAGGGFTPVDDPEHHRNVFNYILKQRDAWIWSFKDEETDNPKITPSPGASLRASGVTTAPHESSS
jgi:REP element-mobilizing transposase RayT